MRDREGYCKICVSSRMIPNNSTVGITDENQRKLQWCITNMELHTEIMMLHAKPSHTGGPTQTTHNQPSASQWWRLQCAAHMWPPHCCYLRCCSCCCCSWRHFRSATASVADCCSAATPAMRCSPDDKRRRAFSRVGHVTTFSMNSTLRIWFSCFIVFSISVDRCGESSRICWRGCVIVMMLIYAYFQLDMPHNTLYSVNRDMKFRQLQMILYVENPFSVAISSSIPFNPSNTLIWYA